MVKRATLAAIILLFCGFVSSVFASPGDVLWGPSTASGSAAPARVVTTIEGIAAVAATHTGSFTMVLYNATSGASSTVGDMPDGTLKGLATDGSNIYLGGTLGNATSGNNTGIITLYDSSGNKNSHFPIMVDYGNETYSEGVVDVAAAGGVGVITGTAYNGTHTLIKTVAYNSSGAQKILKTEGDNSYNASAKAVAANGSYVAVVGNAENSTIKDVLVFLYDYNNNKKWGKLYSTGQAEKVVDVAMDSNNNVYVLIEATSTRGDNDTLLVKYDYQGNKKWEKWFDMNDLKKNDHPAQLAIDSSNNIYVAGYYDNNGDDYFVVKFSASDGSVS
jgi:hypothetical protein